VPYARERRVLSLEEAVRKMSAQAADAMHFGDRGRIAPGQVADLVVFDHRRVADLATFEEPLSFPVGIEHVIVRGVEVVSRGEPTGARPGRVVRKR
jgi:N-acyl-D-amino-acid deacylase